MSRKLEIACFNLESALIAAKAGADRIEFCDNFKEGGTTPNPEEFKILKSQTTIPIYVMIRSRGGNFFYSDIEFEKLKKQIALFKELKADGFVLGILDKDNEIALERNKQLVELAAPLPCSFHRAFDQTSNAAKSLEAVIWCGFKTILTSGLKNNAMDGIEQLAELVKLADNRISIMPGGGVRSSNIALLIEKTKADFYHSSAIVEGKELADENEIKSLLKSILRQQ